MVKNLLANAGDVGLIPGFGRCPAEGKKKKNRIPVFLPGKLPWTGETWWATVHGVTKSWIQLKTTIYKQQLYTYTYIYILK